MIKKKTVNFGASVAQKAGGMGKAPKELTIEEKLENVTQNTSHMLNEHANALNAISMWIASNDKKVAQAGNVLTWAMKEQAKQQRLAERKAAYKASKKVDKQNVTRAVTNLT